MSELALSEVSCTSRRHSVILENFSSHPLMIMSISRCVIGWEVCANLASSPDLHGLHVFIVCTGVKDYFGVYTTIHGAHFLFNVRSLTNSLFELKFNNIKK